MQWFEEDEATGILKLGLVHPDRYSSQYCIGDVDLELVDAKSKTYRFVDPSRRRELHIAHKLALPSAQRVAKNSAAGGGGGAKKRVRDVYEAEGLDRVFSDVKRRPGARKKQLFLVELAAYHSIIPSSFIVNDKDSILWWLVGGCDWRKSTQDF